MAQFVIEFGAPALSPVLNAVLSVVERPTMLDESFPSGGGYRVPATKDALDAIPQRFADRKLSSVTIRTDAVGIRYGLVMEPHFSGQGLAMWMGTIELTANDWRPYWDRILKFEGLVFACVGDEEGVELSDQELTVDSFPWDRWPLLVGAVRHSTGGEELEWLIRERASGTAAYWK